MVHKLNESIYENVYFDDINETLASCYDKIDFAKTLLYSILYEPGAKRHNFNSLSEEERKKLRQEIRKVQVAADYCSMYLKDIKNEVQ